MMYVESLYCIVHFCRMERQTHNNNHVNFGSEWLPQHLLAMRLVSRKVMAATRSRKCYQVRNFCAVCTPKLRRSCVRFDNKLAHFAPRLNCKLARVFDSSQFFSVLLSSSQFFSILLSTFLIISDNETCLSPQPSCADLPPPPPARTTTTARACMLNCSARFRSLDTSSSALAAVASSCFILLAATCFICWAWAPSI